MASFGARRFGLSENPVELDLRLQRIEAELLKRQQGNIESSSQAQRVTVKQPLPQVTGVGLDRNVVGGIGITWTSILNPDLSYYEIQFSTVDQFTSDTTTTLRVSGGENTALFTNATPGGTYYARVRAVSTRVVESGQYSSTLNTTTGEATVNHIALGATSNLVQDEIFTFDPVTIGTGSAIYQAEFGAAWISTVGGIVFPYSVAEYDATVTYVGGTNRLTVAILRGDQIIDVGTWDFLIDTAGATLRYTVSGIATPDQPLAGNHVYRVRYSIDDNSAANDLDITFYRQLMELVEYRR